MPFPPDRWYCKSCWDALDAMRPFHVPWCRDAYRLMVEGNEKASGVSPEVVRFPDKAEGRVS